MDTPPLPPGYKLDSPEIPPLPSGYTLDKGDEFIRSELFPIKRNPATGEVRLAYPGFVKDIAGMVKAAEETPAAYDPTTGETHASPELMKAGAAGALLALPLAPEAEAARMAVAPESTMTERMAAYSSPAPPVRKTAEQLKTAGGAKINLMADLPTPFHRSGFTPHLDRITADLKEMKYNPEDHPLVTKALNRVTRDLATVPSKVSKSYVPPEGWDAHIEKIRQSRGDEVAERTRRNLAAVDLNPDASHKFLDLINVRKSKQLKNALRSPNETERKMAVGIKDSITDYAKSLGNAGKVYAQGLEEYSKGSKIEDVEEMVTNAISRARRRYTSAGFPHALALEADKIVNSKGFRFWTPDEQARIKLLSEGGDFTQRVANTIGKFSVRGQFGFVLDLLTGHPLAGATVGEIGRQASRQISLKAVEGLKDLIHAGGRESELAKLNDLLSQSVTNKLAKQPGPRQAMINWSKAKGPAKKVAARVLAISIAKASNTPTLVPRIEQEVNGLDNQ